VRVELEDLRTSAEKVRCIAWANEPASTLEDSVVELTALRSMIDAAEVEALGAYDASKEWKAAGALSAPARIAEMTCGRAESIRWRRGLARKLRSMPHTVSAFELGDISIDHVGVLCRANLVCLALEFARDEEVLVDKARTLPFDEFVAEVQRWRDIVDPEGAERRALSNYEERRVHSSRTFEGMGQVDAWMEPLGFHEFDTELERHYQRLLDADWAEARARLGDTATVNDLSRTPAQRRHDALVEMARSSQAHGGAGAEPTLGTTIVCDHDTYLTALARILAEMEGNDPNDIPYPTQRRCEFADGTPVTPEQAVWASIAGWIQTLAVDPHGHPLNYSRTRRFFQGPQRDALMIAFAACDDPGCRIRSVHCQIDHLLAWIDGGPTDVVNGKPRCEGHNLWKEHVRARERRGRPEPKRWP